MNEGKKKNEIVLDIKDATIVKSGKEGLVYVNWPTPIPVYPDQYQSISWRPGERYSFINGGFYIVGDPHYRVFQVSGGFAPNGESWGITVYNNDAQKVLVQIWFIAFANY